MSTLSSIEEPPFPSARNLTRPGLLFGLILLIAVLFIISGGVLWDLGINYEGVTGSAASKIHPFTYMVIIAFAFQALRARQHVDFLARTFHRTPASLLIILAGLALFCQIVVRNGAGMAGAIDTYLGPAFLLMLFGWADQTELRKIEIVLHVLMAFNALVALVEFGTNTKFFPYRFDGEIFPIDSRSTALQGHPLTNALVTACYVLALFNGSRWLPSLLKTLMIVLQLAALVVFGSRSAIVVTLLLGTLYLIGRGKQLLRRPRVSLLRAAAVILFVVLIPVVVIPSLSAIGFFDALFSRFESDGGSANARVAMFDLFSQIPLRDLLIGPDLDLIASLRRVNGLELGIENPIVKTVLYQGVFTAILLTTAVVLFLREVAGRCQNGVWLPMLAFSILLMTSETIGGKTTLLAKFIVIVLCMYARRFPPDEAGPSAPAHQ